MKNTNAKCQRCCIHSYYTTLHAENRPQALFFLHQEKKILIRRGNG